MEYTHTHIKSNQMEYTHTHINQMEYIITKLK